MKPPAYSSRRATHSSTPFSDSTQPKLTGFLSHSLTPVKDFAQTHYWIGKYCGSFEH
jgi:hypothetical protein